MPGADQGDADLLFRVVGGILRAVKQNMILKLFFCLLIDTIGFATYLLPGLGEMGDIAWAPIQAVLLLYLFGSYTTMAAGFAEEILPGTDFIPTATMSWTLENINAPQLDGMRRIMGIIVKEAMQNKDRSA